MLESFVNNLFQHNCTGLFLLAFVSNAIPYSTVPYLVFIAPFIARYKGLDLVFAILSLAIGASLGKVIVFLFGRSLMKIKRVREHLSGVSSFFARHKRSVFFTVFLVAALPVPDDVFYIPIGSSGYSLLYFTLAILLGKLIITILTAIYGFMVTYVLEGVIGLDPVISVPIMIVLTVILLIGLGRVDWNTVEESYETRGGLYALVHAMYLLTKCILIDPLVKLISLLSKYIKRR